MKKRIMSATKGTPAQFIAELQAKIDELSGGVIGATKIQASEVYWQELESKEVTDSDGSLTDYTLYTDGNGRYICMFGDKDWYGPDEDYADWEGDSEESAYEWFDNYVGYDDMDYDDDDEGAIYL